MQTVCMSSSFQPRLYALELLRNQEAVLREEFQHWLVLFVMKQTWDE